MKGVCKKCGCTETTACNHIDYGPCWWTDDSQELCSHCDDEFPDPEHVVRYSKGISLEDAITRDIGPVGSPERTAFDEQVRKEVENATN